MRRLTVECKDGHKEEIIIKSNEGFGLCKVLVERCKKTNKKTDTLFKLQNTNSKEANLVSVYVGPCRKRREIVWDQKGTQGAPGFRIQGLGKNFR